MTSASTFSNKPEPELAFDPQIGETADPTALLPKRPFPTIDATYLQHGKGRDENETLVVMKPNALQQVHQHAISNMRSELGGFLLGRAFQDNGKHHLLIETALPAVSNDHGPVHFTFGADSWSECHRRKAEQYPDLQIVGWYHTHPGLGVFYSSDDVVVHTAGFSLPWHVGLVVDPVRNEAALFGWVNDELECLSGYYEQTASTTAASAIAWRYVNTHVWNMANYDLPPMSNEAMPTALAMQQPPLISSREWLTMAAVVGGLLFFFAAGWIATLNRQVNQLEQVILTQVDANPAAIRESCPDPRLRILAPETETAVSQGTRIQFLGTADLPNATRYELWARPANSDAQWSKIGTNRFDTQFGTIARWNTRDVATGVYDVAITAVDRSNLLLPDLPPCQIQLEITQ